MLFLISKIRPLDEPQQIYSFKIQEYCYVCNIDFNNGGNYFTVKNSLKGLADKSVWIKDSTGRETLLRWLDKVQIDRHSGMIEIRFHNDMYPYLLDLQKKYTKYALVNILAMKSKYGIRLYEFLKSYENLEDTITVPLAELKKRMGCENYERFPDFRRIAFEPALRDIENNADIEVVYNFKKSKGSRSYDTIVFDIYIPDERSTYDRLLYRETELDYDKKAMKVLHTGGVKAYLEYIESPEFQKRKAKHEQKESQRSFDSCADV